MLCFPKAIKKNVKCFISNTLSRRIPSRSVRCVGIEHIPNNVFNSRINKTIQCSWNNQESINKINYSKNLKDPNLPILICTGPTGTGKTYLSCKEGITQLIDGKYKKILITRPTVSIENEQIGFLPGTIDKKMDPWIRPVYDNIGSVIGHKEVEQMIKYKIIELCPIAYLRGRTFTDTFIIADEMQNSTKMQFQTLLTRVGKDSKLVVNGDLEQSDNISDNGLYDFIKRLKEYLETKNVKYIQLVNLQKSDIIRHPCVTEILDIYSIKKN